MANKQSTSLWGELRFRGGGPITIRLAGIFDERHIPFFEDPRGIIIGELDDGARCTILGYQGDIEEIIHGESRSYITLISANYLLGGIAFDTWDLVQFQRFSVQFSHLEEWFSAPYDLEGIPGESEFTLRKKEESFICEIPEMGFTIKNGVSYSSTFHPTPKEFKIAYSHHLQLATDEMQPLGWFLDQVECLRDFFSFVIGMPIYTLRLSPENTEGYPLQLFLPVDVPEIHEVDSYDFRTLYRDLHATLAETLRAWFRTRRERTTAFRLYFSLMYGNGMHEETVLLNLTQLLEHVHPLIFPGRSSYCSKDTWKAFRKWFKRFPEGIKPLPDVEQQLKTRGLSLKDLLLSRIGPLNQLSLHSKLENLVRDIPSIILQDIFHYPPDLEVATSQFVKQIGSIRNSLTHPSEQNGLLSREELLKLCLRLWAVLTYWLATDFISDEKVMEEMSYKSAMHSRFLVRFGKRL